MELFEKTLSSEIIFDGAVVHLRVDQVELPNGNTSSREIVSHPGGVAVVPLHKDGTVTVVRQFRYSMGRVVMEIPAGKLERGEDHRATGLRELEEETGLTCKKFTYLGAVMASPGFTDEMLYMYLAEDLTQGDANPDEDEFLEGERVPFSQLIDGIMAGEIEDGKTVAALLKTKILLGL